MTHIYTYTHAHTSRIHTQAHTSHIHTRNMHTHTHTHTERERERERERDLICELNNKSIIIAPLGREADKTAFVKALEPINIIGSVLVEA